MEFEGSHLCNWVSSFTREQRIVSRVNNGSKCVCLGVLCTSGGGGVLDLEDGCWKEFPRTITEHIIIMADKIGYKYD